ncbi:MAG: putative zinc-binding protein [Caldisericaceae bacterium]|nr:putative zinc-binding protein [Caldisericaceae bacterium]
MSNNYQPEIKIAIANCSGRSNIGQMSLEIAKRVDKALPYANINCLPAIFPKLKPAEKFEEADAIVVIDGCKEACVLETIKLGGFEPALRIAPDEDYGVEKTPGLDFDQKVMEEIAADVIEKVKHLAQQLLEEKKQKLNSQG